MVTIYGARGKAEAMIARVRRVHDRIAGSTPAGNAYRANDPELLNWVQGTAAYGFGRAETAVAVTQVANGAAVQSPAGIASGGTRPWPAPLRLRRLRAATTTNSRFRRDKLLRQTRFRRATAPRTSPAKRLALGDQQSTVAWGQRTGQCPSRPQALQRETP